MVEPCDRSAPKTVNETSLLNRTYTGSNPAVDGQRLDGVITSPTWHHRTLAWGWSLQNNQRLLKTVRCLVLGLLPPRRPPSGNTSLKMENISCYAKHFVMRWKCVPMRKLFYSYSGFEAQWAIFWSNVREDETISVSALNHSAMPKSRQGILRKPRRVMRYFVNYSLLTNTVRWIVGLSEPPCFQLAMLQCTNVYDVIRHVAAFLITQVFTKTIPFLLFDEVQIKTSRCFTMQRVCLPSLTCYKCIHREHSIQVFTSKYDRILNQSWNAPNELLLRKCGFSF